MSIFPLIALLLLGACKELKKAPPLSTVIPDEASIVITADIVSLSQKANMEELLEMNTFRKLEKDFFREVGREGEDFFDLFIDYEKSGVDLSVKPLFFFYNKGGSDIYAMVFALNDQTKFKKKIEDWADEDADTEEKYAYLIKDGEQEIVGWNANTALIIGGEEIDSKRELRRLLGKLFEQEQDNSLLTNENFNQFLDKKQDLGIWVNTDELEDVAKKYGNDLDYKKLGGDVDFFDNNYFHAFMNFENGNMKVTGDFFLNDDIQDYSDQFLGEAINADHLAYIPKENLLGLFGLSLNFKNILDEFEDESGGNELREIADKLGMSKRQLKRLMKGDITVAFTGFGETRHAQTRSRYGYGRSRSQIILKNNPQFVLVADIVEEDFLQVIQIMATEINRKQFGSWESLKIVDDCYVLSAPNFPELYFLIDNEKLILSNAQETMRHLVSGPLASNEQLPTRLQNKITDGVASAFWNMDIYEYPDDLLNEMRMEMGRTKFSQFKESMSLFDNMLVKCTKNGLVFELNLEDEAENSLYALMKFAGEME